MDITNNVSISNLNLQTGGENNDDISSNFDISSDKNITQSKKKKVTPITLMDEDIIAILNGEDIAIELDNFDFNEINKISYFNKLTNNQKTLVINRLYEKVPKNQKNIKSNDTSIIKESYFYCKNCGYNEKIPEKMFIFSRSYEKKNNNIYDNKIINYKHDNTIPYSKKYTCINQDCPTHKNPIIKSAVFYRLNNTYIIRYICTICDYYWNTVTDNEITK